MEGEYQRYSTPQSISGYGPELEEDATKRSPSSNSRHVLLYWMTGHLPNFDVFASIQQGETRIETARDWKQLHDDHWAFYF